MEIVKLTYQFGKELKGDYGLGKFLNIINSAG